MSVEAPLAPRTAPHVIVLGSEKGGSGKSTLAIHIAVALLKLGQRVAAIDLDSRQRTLTHFIDSRRDWATRARVEIRLPTLYHVQRADSSSISDNESEEFARLHEAVLGLQNNHGFVVNDTPPSDSFLMRLAHGLAAIFVDAAQ
jgi:chromosome partitioning protein